MPIIDRNYLHINNLESAVGIISSADYSPFGVQLDGRSESVGSYRYGFQGQERDDEIKGEGNSVNYSYRMYDSRVGRWLAIDPLFAKYPYLGPYNFVGNSPIRFVDSEGKEIIDANGKVVNVKVVDGKPVFSGDGKLSAETEETIKILASTKIGAKYLKKANVSRDKFQLEVSDETVLFDAQYAEDGLLSKYPELEGKNFDDNDYLVAMGGNTETNFEKSNGVSTYRVNVYTGSIELLIQTKGEPGKIENVENGGVTILEDPNNIKNPSGEVDTYTTEKGKTLVKSYSSAEVGAAATLLEELSEALSGQTQSEEKSQELQLEFVKEVK